MYKTRHYLGRMVVTVTIGLVLSGCETQQSFNSDLIAWLKSFPYKFSTNASHNDPIIAQIDHGNIRRSEFARWYSRSSRGVGLST